MTECIDLRYTLGLDFEEERPMKFTRVSKPDESLTLASPVPFTLNGHTFMAYYAADFTYYEHDETTDRWFRMDDD